MDPEDEAGASWKHMIAGAFAGAAEHMVMFPVDTIKTHVQAHRSSNQVVSVRKVAMTLWKEGPLTPFRGISAVAIGAGPAHAIYFTSYEFFKHALGCEEHNGAYSWFMQGFSGILANTLAEALHTPMDTVKQRRQLNLNKYTGTIHCMKQMYKSEGLGAFYKSYMTTMTMSLPFSFIYFSTYELLRKALKSPSESYDPFAFVVAGTGAGVCAAALTNPLDVAKTRLQTQTVGGKIKYSGMVDALTKIWKLNGVRGFTSGVLPRMLFNGPSAGISWLTYEYFKHILRVSPNTQLSGCAH